MLKTHFKFPRADMAKRLFRRSKSTSNLQLLALNMTEEGLDERCSDLSREEIECLCNFRLEVNMLRAQNGQEAVQLEEAMKCLRASQFNAAKAVDIYRNYQKYRENLQLDSLKPHREPLSTEIGSKKMEVVGTRDQEGSPIVLFTASRHETFKWDNKSSMQLLFYTLDQVSESEAALERGVVFIMDLRDMTSDPRYTGNILSVLKDGYPIRIKMIFLLFNGPRTSKTMHSLQKMVKYDLNKVKMVHLAELKAHFLPEQLPLSLGGTYSHQVTSPLHVRSCSEDDLASGTSRKPLRPPPASVVRSGSGSSSGSVVRHGSGGSARPRVGSDGRTGTVNQLLEMFESGGGEQATPSQATPSQNSASQQRSGPTTPSKPIPSPPLQVPATSHQKGGATPPTKPLPPSSNRKPGNLPAVKVSPVPPPKKLILENTETKSAGSGQRKPVAKTDGSHGNGGPAAMLRKKPMLPQAGGRTPLSQKSLGGDAQSHAHISGEKSEVVDRTDTKSGGGTVSAAVSLFKTQFGGGEKPQTPPNKPMSLTSSLAEKSKVARTQSEDNGLGPRKILASNAFITDDKSSLHQQNSSSRLRARADSAGRTGHSVTKPESGPSSAGGSPKRLHASKGKKSDGSPHMSPPAPPQQNSGLARPSSSDYENMEPSQFSMGPAPPSTVPVPAILTRMDIDRRDSDADVYENVCIGFAGPPTDMSGPMPPLPPPKEPGKPASQSYENVNFLKSSDRHGRKKLEKSLSVEDDDDTLFGEEGPPGTKENIYENFGPDKGNRQMSLKDLEAHVEKLGKNGLATEYCRIRNEPISGSHKACRLSCNKSKNRYKDVICYDKTRVQLNALPGVEGSDYIHGNYVDGHNCRNHFILTQGPKDKTVPDFWRMIWEKHVLVIVMVTKCVELGKRKCALYWPDVRGGCGGGGAGAAAPHRHGDYQVSMTDVQQRDGYDVSTLCVEHKGEQRMITHFQFLAWPDYGIPTSGSSLLNLIFAVRQAQAKGRQSANVSSNAPEPHPIIVHCSAGVGRSGAFCSIDNCLSELDERHSVNFQGAVRKMRKQRAYSIQTEDQYEFGYRTILEYAHNKVKYNK